MKRKPSVELENRKTDAGSFITIITQDLLTPFLSGGDLFRLGRTCKKLHHHILLNDTFDRVGWKLKCVQNGWDYWPLQLDHEDKLEDVADIGEFYFLSIILWLEY